MFFLSRSRIAETLTHPCFLFAHHVIVVPKKFLWNFNITFALKKEISCAYFCFCLYTMCLRLLHISYDCIGTSGKNCREYLIRYSLVKRAVKNLCILNIISVMFNGNIRHCEFFGHIPMLTLVGVKIFWSCSNRN